MRGGRSVPLPTLQSRRRPSRELHLVVDLVIQLELRRDGPRAFGQRLGIEHVARLEHEVTRQIDAAGERVALRDAPAGGVVLGGQKGQRRQARLVLSAPVLYVLKSYSASRRLRQPRGSRPSRWPCRWAAGRRRRARHTCAGAQRGAIGAAQVLRRRRRRRPPRSR